jgi:prepilin-type N-terminal cleavage/methylation domain-containing protein
MIGAGNGFTYTEVLISLAVISIGVLGFSLNTISVTRANLNSASQTAAANLAEDKLEQLSAQRVHNNVDRCPDSGDRAISASGAAGGIFDRCWTIKDSDVAAGLKEISVIVRWRDSETRSVSLSTLVFAE